MPGGEESGVHLPLPVLDRLIDERPEEREEGVPSYATALRATLEAVRRDLQWLLNYRRSDEELRSRDTGEIGRSLATYGIPDLTSVNLKSEREKERVRRSIEAAVRRFEPRLDRVRVVPVEKGPQESVTHFRIDALLRVDPAPEPVSFDTAVQWQDREVRVE